LKNISYTAPKYYDSDSAQSIEISLILVSHLYQKSIDAQLSPHSQTKFKAFKRKLPAASGRGKLTE